MSHNVPTSQADNGGNRESRPLTVAVLVVAMFAAGYATRTGLHRAEAATPDACRHAADSTWTHLHALSDESGTRVSVGAIHADMAGLRHCR